MNFNAPGFKAALTSFLGNDLGRIESKVVGGGCISEAFQIETSKGTFFVKKNASSAISMFQKEMRGLNALAEPHAIAIAKPIGTFVVDQAAFLLMEWIEAAPPSAKFWDDFGASLAVLHQVSNPTHGWLEDNFIGSLVQHNAPTQHFFDFFANQRILPLLKIAQDKGLIDEVLAKRCHQLLGKLSQLIPETKPALLHGDLWSGNFVVGPQGNAVLIDPAVYFGHPEVELAFTRLFGGFDQRFYDAYRATNPFEEGWEERIALFNLYPLMVHLILFGRSYLPEVRRTMVKFT